MLTPGPGHFEVHHPHDAVHGWRRVLRWTLRIVAGLVALVVLAVLAVLLFISTDRGREMIRSKAEAAMQKVFVGGARIGKVEGSPLGELVVRGVVIDGPDHQPAIQVGTLRVRVGLLALVHEHVRVDELVAEDVDIAAKRDGSGAFELAQLTAPSPPSTEPKSKSSWTIDVPRAMVKRGHVMVDTGTPQAQVVNLDDIAITANAKLPAGGGLSAGLRLTATWRERRAPIAITVRASDDTEVVTVPELAVAVGDVRVGAHDLRLQRRGERTPLVSGALRVSAPRDAVAALAPIELPADVTLVLAASAAPGAAAHAETIELLGALGATPIHAELDADLDAQRVTGALTTGELDLGALTAGKLAATAGAHATFDVARGPAGELPVAHVHVDGHGVYGDVPPTDFALDLASTGQRATLVLTGSGAATANVHAAIDRTASGFTLASAHLTVSVDDPRRASGGRAPVHGALAADLDASGTLTPAPDVRVAGTIRGTQLRVQNLWIASLGLTIDAAHLPAHPAGTVSLRVADLVTGATRVGVIALDTAAKSDAGTVAVELKQHHIEANGANWRGTGGTLTLTPERVTLAGLRSHSATGSLQVAATYARAGRAAGDLTAQVDLTGFALATLHPTYLGAVGAHVDVARRALRWSGDVRVTGRGLALGAKARLVDVDAAVTARPGSVQLTAQATPRDAGAIKLAVDLAAPARLEDIAAWRARGRDALRSLELDVNALDLARVAEIAPAAGDPHQRPTGKVDGKLMLSGTTASGSLHVRDVRAPQLRGLGAIDAALDLVAPAAGDVQPTLTVAVKDVGRAVGTARITLPDHPFDARAWRALGLRALRAANLKTDTLAFDPPMLARLGVTSTMRGKLRLGVDVTEAAQAVRVNVAVDDLRGNPVAKPVSVRVDLGIDEHAATGAIAMTSQGDAVTMLKLDAHVPVSLAQLRANPAAARTLPITASLDIPQTSAPRLLDVLGKSQLTAGTLAGKIDVTGTLADPSVTAHLTGTGLAVQPGTRGERIQAVQQLVIDASWKDKHGKLKLDSTEDRGGTLSLVAEGAPTALGNATATLEAHAFDLSPVLSLAPGAASDTRGSLDGKLAITGFDPRTAKVTGELHLHNAHVPIAPTVGTLRDATIDVAIREHDIKLAANGRLGAGKIRMDGSIALDGATLTGGEAKLVLRKVSPIGAVEPQIDADITAKIARKGTTWTADVTIDNAFVKVTKASGEKLKPVGMPSDLTIGDSRKPPPANPKTGAATVATAPPPPKAPILVANVVIHPVKVESDEFRTTLSGKLAIKADADAVGMVGKIDAQSGDLDLFGRRYRVEQANVTFDGTVDPQLAIRITYDFPDVTTVTQVRGRLSKPKLVLSSNPALYTKSQLLGFLLGGEPNGNPNSGSARDKAAEAGESLIANQIGGYVKQALPFSIDVIKYEAASVTSSAAITVGSWVTHTLFVAFRTHPDALPNENSGEGEVEYWVGRRLEVQGTAGDRNYDQLDVLWRKRF